MLPLSGTRKKLASAAARCWVAAAFALSVVTSAVASTEESSYAPVLAPEQFAGEAAMGYAAATAAPEICAKLFCYCGCDSTDNHTNLLDCFTSTHGSDCHICQEEALMALRMQKEGKSLKEIQKSVDETYAHMYPFKNPTAALKKYRVHKLYSGKLSGLCTVASTQELTERQECCPSCCSRHNNAD